MGFRTIGPVVAAAALAMSVVGAAQVAHATDKPNPKRTYIVNCQGKLDYKPKEIVIACADAGVRFDNITWSRWTMNGATGRGTLVVNTCEPTCADGNFINYRRVRLTLGMTASGPGFGTFVNVFSEVKGDFGASLGPALARTSTWKLDNAIRD